MFALLITSRQVYGDLLINIIAQILYPQSKYRIGVIFNYYFENIFKFL